MSKLNKFQFRNSASGNELDELTGPINTNPNEFDSMSKDDIKSDIDSKPKDDKSKPDQRLEALNRKTFF